MYILWVQVSLFMLLQYDSYFICIKYTILTKRNKSNPVKLKYMFPIKSQCVLRPNGSKIFSIHISRSQTSNPFSIANYCKKAFSVVSVLRGVWSSQVYFYYWLQFTCQHLESFQTSREYTVKLITSYQNKYLIRFMFKSIQEIYGSR